MIGDGVSAPWHNRPSLIACWEHSAAAQDNTGSPVNTALFVDGGLILWVDAGGVPFCIPRACRMTRACLHYYSFSGELITGTLEIFKATDCGGPFVSGGSHVFVDPDGDGTRLCECFDLSIEFDQCDQWYPFVSFSPDATFPFLRAVFHFELR